MENEEILRKSISYEMGKPYSATAEDIESITNSLKYYSDIIEDYQDAGFAEIQRWFNVYAFDDPFFYQTSGYHGTVNPLTSYPTQECFAFNKNYFLPAGIS